MQLKPLKVIYGVSVWVGWNGNLEVGARQKEAFHNVSLLYILNKLKKIKIN